MDKGVDQADEERCRKQQKGFPHRKAGLNIYLKKDYGDGAVRQAAKRKTSKRTGVTEKDARDRGGVEVDEPLWRPLKGEAS